MATFLEGLQQRATGQLCALSWALQCLKHPRLQACLPLAAAASMASSDSALSWPPPCCLGADAALFEALAEAEVASEPTLHFAEIFAGKAAVSRALAAQGFRGRCMDKEYHHGHDMLKPMGLLLVLSTALEILPGGVFWCAPPCSSWVFMSRGSTGRHVLIEGDALNPGVVMANAIVERLVLLLEILTLRGVYWIIEQPASTVMWLYPAMRNCLQRHGLREPVYLEMGSYGGRSVKPTHLIGTAPYLQHLRRSCSGIQLQRFSGEGVVTTTAIRDASGKKRPHGTAELKGTQAYPEGFGARHATLFREHFGAVAGSDQTIGIPAPPARATRRGTLPAAATAELLCGLRARLPGPLKAELEQGPWWLRDFLGEPWA